MLCFTGFNKLTPIGKWVLICPNIVINTFLLCVLQDIFNHRSKIVKVSCFFLQSHQFISVMLVGMSLSQLLELALVSKTFNMTSLPIHFC